MNLTKTIFLYLIEKEFEMLTKDAERANMSMSRYIRHQIQKAKMKPTLDMDYEKYIKLLTPICDKLSIDSKTVWYGSVNFLSYGTAEESIMRFESGDVAGELLDTVIKICKALDVEPEEFYIGNPSRQK